MDADIRLRRLVEAVAASSKYHDLDEELIRDVGRRELTKYPHLQTAIKATKTKLHQVAGVYLSGREPYAAWLSELQTAYASGEAEMVNSASQSIMRHHSSTRERLPILDEFFARTLADLAPIRSCLDVACGLNPLAVPWMPLAPSAEYFAFDVVTGMTGFLGDFFAIPQVAAQVRGSVQTCDVISSPPSHPADVALLLKTIPCLEQVDKEAGRRLVHGLNARHLLISFPKPSLGGKKKGMETHYSARLAEITAGTSWSITRFDFVSELAFLVAKW
jgi:16S rRNA (guanine(1405)-N(7))-methyltransferase